MNVEKMLETAVRIEEDGYWFYTDSIDKITDENGKLILQFLANEEKKHKTFFKGLLRAQRADDGLLHGLEAPRIFPRAKKFVEGETTGVDVEILKHGREAEIKSIEFYAGFLEGTKDETLCRGLGIIIREEKQHLEWIDGLLDCIGKNHCWGDIHEHLSLDGG